MVIDAGAPGGPLEDRTLPSPQLNLLLSLAQRSGLRRQIKTPQELPPACLRLIPETALPTSYASATPNHFPLLQPPRFPSLLPALTTSSACNPAPAPCSLFCAWLAPRTQAKARSQETHCRGKNVEHTQSNFAVSLGLNFHVAPDDHTQNLAPIPQNFTDSSIPMKRTWRLSLLE